MVRKRHSKLTVWNSCVFLNPHLWFDYPTPTCMRRNTPKGLGFLFVFVFKQVRAQNKLLSPHSHKEPGACVTPTSPECCASLFLKVLVNFSTSCFKNWSSSWLSARVCRAKNIYAKMGSVMLKILKQTYLIKLIKNIHCYADTVPNTPGTAHIPAETG